MVVFKDTLMLHLFRFRTCFYCSMFCELVLKKLFNVFVSKAIFSLLWIQPKRSIHYSTFNLSHRGIWDSERFHVHVHWCVCACHTWCINMKEEKEAICCTDVLHGGPLRLHYFMRHTLDVMSLMNKVTMVTFMKHMYVFVKEGYVKQTEWKSDRNSSSYHYIYLTGLLKWKTFFMQEAHELLWWFALNPIHTVLLFHTRWSTKSLLLLDK